MLIKVKTLTGKGMSPPPHLTLSTADRCPTKHLHFFSIPLPNCLPGGVNATEIELDIEQTDKIQRIKERVEEKEGIPPAQQRLIFGGKQM